MEYILVNTCETIQNQFISQNLQYVEREFFGRITHDLDVLRSYGVSDFNKVYDNYTIYKVTRSPQTHFFQIVETYKFEITTNKFKCVNQIQHINTPTKIESSVASTALAHADAILSKKTEDVQLFDITCKKQTNSTVDFDINEDVSDKKGKKLSSKNDVSLVDDPFGDEEYEDEDEDDEDDEYEEEDDDELVDDVDDDPDVVPYSEDTDTDTDTEDENDDTSELKTVKEKIKQLQELQAVKKARIEEFEKKRDKAREKLADEMCEVSLAKKKEQYEKEKLEESKRKFAVDRNVYEKIKEDVLSGKLDENNITPFFINTYKVLREMDTNNTLQDPDAFNIFMKSYADLVNKLKDTIKEEDEPYGIFN